jgi:hypothetical protein
MNAGDLYINVGGTFQTNTGSVFGVATTSHANVVTQAYPGAWTSVTAGSLYSEATFATGTYEAYQQAKPNYQPDDGDGSTGKNSYPTLIMTGTQVAGDVSATAYFSTPSEAWDYEIYYKIAVSSLGIDPNEQVQLFWAMECGNDGTTTTFEKAIPEPTSIALLMAGISALAVRNRRKQ